MPDVLQSGFWSKVVRLPAELMLQADARRHESPIIAAGLAQVGVAIRMLAVAPIRIANLAQIEIESHLVRPCGPGTPFFLTFEPDDVKTTFPSALS